jgi:hypothetical protein
MLNTTDGPVVVEVPPATDKTIFFGSVIDAWEVPVTDMGPRCRRRQKRQVPVPSAGLRQAGAAREFLDDIQGISSTAKGSQFQSGRCHA